MPFLFGGPYALHHYTGIPKSIPEIEVFGRKVPVAPPEECHGHGPVSRLLGDADPNVKLKTEDRKLKTGSRNGFQWLGAESNRRFLASHKHKAPIS